VLSFSTTNILHKYHQEKAGKKAEHEGLSSKSHCSAVGDLRFSNLSTNLS
jgi:hypothetical protein